jgi:hypothetical protein
MLPDQSDKLPPDDAMKTEEVLRLWTGAILAGRRPVPDLLPAGTDPAKVREFLQQHRAHAAVYDRAGRNPEIRLSIEPWRRLQGDCRQLAATELIRENELVRMLGAAGSRLSPPPIVFKGTALAYQIYPAPHLRVRDDTDMLVASSTMEATRSFFAEHGYRPSDAIDAPLVMRQASFIMQDALNVTHAWDVHWAFSNRPAFADFLTFEGLLRTAVEVRVDKITFLTPNIVDSLLIACLHLIGHHANDVRLIWLYDIHLLAASLGPAERRRFLDQATERRQIRTACHAAFELTQHYIPGQPVDELRRALDPGDGSTWKSDRTHLAVLVDDADAIGRGNRLRFVAQHVFPSADYMVKRFAIRHRWQLPFWYLVRIGRAIPKLFRRV